MKKLFALFLCASFLGCVSGGRWLNPNSAGKIIRTNTPPAPTKTKKPNPSQKITQKPSPKPIATPLKEETKPPVIPQPKEEIKLPIPVINLPEAAPPSKILKPENPDPKALPNAPLEELPPLPTIPKIETKPPTEIPPPIPPPPAPPIQETIPETHPTTGDFSSISGNEKIALPKMTESPLEKTDNWKRMLLFYGFCVSSLMALWVMYDRIKNKPSLPEQKQTLKPKTKKNKRSLKK